MTRNHKTHHQSKQERSLRSAFALTFVFFLIELFGGILTKSLALVSDAAHMFTDVTALAISYFAMRMSQKKADHLRTFGYYRFEILAAALNASLLFIVAFYIAFEAYQRIHSPQLIESKAVLLIASIGLLVNLWSMRLLHREQGANLNLKAAYLEVWSDALGSIGVIISALIIQWGGWYWVDSLVAMGIALWILPRTWILLKASIHILLEGVPEQIDLKDLSQSFLNIDGVLDVHELHVWGLSHDKISLTAHVVIDRSFDTEEMIRVINDMIFKKYAILHTTLQLEYEACEACSGCLF